MQNSQETSIKASSLFGFKSKFWGKGESKSDEESQPLDVEAQTAPEPSKSLGEKLKFWKKGPSLMEGLNNKVSNMQERFEDYKYGMVTLAFGLFVIFLSFLYLPFIAIAPQKFCALFSIGGAMCLSSLGIMTGFKSIFQKLLAKKMLPYSFGYFCSLILGIYCSVISKRYLVSLFCIVV